MFKLPEVAAGMKGNTNTTDSGSAAVDVEPLVDVGSRKVAEESAYDRVRTARHRRTVKDTLGLKSSMQTAKAQGRCAFTRSTR